MDEKQRVIQPTLEKFAINRFTKLASTPCLPRQLSAAPPCSNLTSGEQKCSGRASDELRKHFRTLMSWSNTSETLPVILLVLSKKQWSMKQKRTNYCDHQGGQQDCKNTQVTRMVSSALSEFSSFRTGTDP